MSNDSGIFHGIDDTNNFLQQCKLDENLDKSNFEKQKTELERQLKLCQALLGGGEIKYFDKEKKRTVTKKYKAITDKTSNKNVLLRISQLNTTAIRILNIIKDMRPFCKKIEPPKENCPTSTPE